jgi:hypothetical protein
MQLIGQTITIEECYEMAESNYPLGKQKELIEKSKKINVSNATINYLPQINLVGQATMQSDVTKIEIPEPLNKFISFDEPNKDQYKFYGEISQIIFDGGATHQQRKIYKASANAEIQQVEVELYKVKEKVTEMYFGILLINEQLKQFDIFKNDIETALEKVKAAVASGVSLQSNVLLLEAEKLNIEQQKISLLAAKKTYLLILSELINKSLDEKTIFVVPDKIIVSKDINRPELTLFSEQNTILESQKKLLISKNLPKLGLFVQGGYGNPALNMFKNEFEPYYIGGVRLVIPISGLYTQGNDMNMIKINTLSNQVKKETFLFNTKFDINKNNTEIEKFNELLKTDNEIIKIRESIKETALAQLENGIINSNDYIKEVNAENLAKQNKILHEMQLLMTLYKQKITTGN